MDDNRVGDAYLYCSLFRDKIIYVPNWEKWLFWTGHHWLEDFFQQRIQIIKHIWVIYREYAERKYEEAKDETNKERRAFLQNQADNAMKRVKQLTSISGQDQLLEMCTRIPDPLLAHGDQFDTIPWVKACQNGVIDLRDGKLYPGCPEDYLFKSSARRV